MTDVLRLQTSPDEATEADAPASTWSINCHCTVTIAQV